MAEIPKKDWKEIVAASGGKSFFVPEKYLPAVQKWQELRAELKKLTALAAEKEVHTSVAMNDMFLELRKYAVETGVEDVWTADIGFDTEALREGVYIINIVDVVG